MEPVTVAECMNRRIVALREHREELGQAGKVKSQTIIEYEKELALTLMKLRNGVRLELEGESICEPPITIMEKIAKGICWESKLKAEEAETNYKTVAVRMNALASELNAFQSISRHLSEV